MLVAIVDAGGHGDEGVEATRVEVTADDGLVGSGDVDVETSRCVVFDGVGVELVGC